MWICLFISTPNSTIGQAPFAPIHNAAASKSWVIETPVHPLWGSWLGLEERDLQKELDCFWVVQLLVLIQHARRSPTLTQDTRTNFCPLPYINDGTEDIHKMVQNTLSAHGACNSFLTGAIKGMKDSNMPLGIHPCYLFTRLQRRQTIMQLKTALKSLSLCWTILNSQETWRGQSDPSHFYFGQWDDPAP